MVNHVISTGGMDIPLLHLEGAPRECGRQYGNTLAKEIAASASAYFEMFRKHHGMEQEAVFAAAQGFASEIGSYDPDLLEEMEGIAEGAGVPFEGIVAINARSELVYGLNAALEGGCTSFAAVPPAALPNNSILGQNWDWKPVQRKVSVILIIDRGDDPRILTLTEAGLVGKLGLNEAGIGLCVNFLLSNKRRAGVPVHILRRKILACWTMSDALKAVMKANRALAANFLVGHEAGEAINIEAEPDEVHITHPVNGVIAHANHFSSSAGDREDLGRTVFPDSLIRDKRAEKLLSQKHGDIDARNAKMVLKDHFNYPDSICRHINSSTREQDQIETLASVVCDLHERTMHICSGPACSDDFVAVPMDMKKH